MDRVTGAFEPLIRENALKLLINLRFDICGAGAMSNPFNEGGHQLRQDRIGELRRIGIPFAMIGLLALRPMA